jgi:peptide chain release factor 2
MLTCKYSSEVIFDWDNALKKLEILNLECEKESLWQDQKMAKNLLKERNYLENAINIVIQASKELNANLELEEIIDPINESQLLQEIENNLIALAKKIKTQEMECLFSGEADENNCFIEIHSGAGGTESDDWASMLLRMYLRWIERHNFKCDIIDQLDGEEAGIKSSTLRVYGKGAYGWLKNESGVHRLVRISPFNSAGKRHTSFASVWVYPIVENDINIDIKESDLRIDTYRSSGAGGQHVNTTDSAVRITHIPTGIVVQSQNNRSQHRNRDECFSMLRSRIYEMELKKKEDAVNQMNASKTDIGWGHQIRSYVLHPYRMVKDLRTSHHSTDTNAVLDGDLDLFMYKNLVFKISGKGLNIKVEDLE